MRRNVFNFPLRPRRVFVAALLLVFPALMPAAMDAQEKPFVRAPQLEGLTFIGGKGEVVSYRGVKAIHLSQTPGAGESLGVLDAPDFKDGTIELEIAGRPAAGASESARGFVGVAFRLGPDSGHFECFYLRPTNGRADDQLRRNHATQYVAIPDYPWERLRKEFPGVYESYVDLEPGAWTKMKIVVSGHKAALYVHGAEQPCLIVNDLKGTQSHGKLALWIGSEAEGYFSELKVTPAP